MQWRCCAGNLTSGKLSTSIEIETYKGLFAKAIRPWRIESKQEGLSRFAISPKGRNDYRKQNAKRVKNSEGVTYTSPLPTSEAGLQDFRLAKLRITSLLDFETYT
jgi:hypothetical protein